MNIHTSEVTNLSANHFATPKFSKIVAQNYQPTLAGNVVPHDWYQRFTKRRGAPDTDLILILADIVYWYRPKKVKDPETQTIRYVNKFLGDAWQTSYRYFERKFGFRHEKVRRLLRKLEKLQICLREFRHVTVRGQTYNNCLFLHLSQEFLESCLVKPPAKVISQNQQAATKVAFVTSKIEGASPPKTNDHIYKENKKKENRSIGSSMKFVEEETQATAFPTKKPSDNNQSVKSLPRTLPSELEPVASSKPPAIQRSTKSLEAFYPLTKEDNEHLQKTSGREFSLQAMNEILLNMSKKIKNRWFLSKKRFLSYMTQVFKNELRDAVKISHENFRIKDNRTAAEVTIEEQEEYLRSIEYNLQVSPEWHFKKKLCGVLKRESAYQLLQAYQRGYLVGEVFKLHLNKPVELSAGEQALILAQVQATHERVAIGGNFQTVERLEFVMPPAKPAIGYSKVPVFEGLWGQIRRALIAYYGHEGEALDRSWFSRLVPAEDEGTKTLTLTAPTAFIRDWIKSNYAPLLDRVTASHQYSCCID